VTVDLLNSFRNVVPAGGGGVVLFFDNQSVILPDLFLFPDQGCPFSSQHHHVGRVTPTSPAPVLTV